MPQGYEKVRDKRWNDVDTKFYEHRSDIQIGISSSKQKRRRCKTTSTQVGLCKQQVLNKSPLGRQQEPQFQKQQEGSKTEITEFERTHFQTS
jgi:hypothetical protein